MVITLFFMLQLFPSLVSLLTFLAGDSHVLTSIFMLQHHFLSTDEFAVFEGLTLDQGEGTNQFMSVNIVVVDNLEAPILEVHTFQL